MVRKTEEHPVLFDRFTLRADDAVTVFSGGWRGRVDWRSSQKTCYWIHSVQKAGSDISWTQVRNTSEGLVGMFSFIHPNIVSINGYKLKSQS